MFELYNFDNDILVTNVTSIAQNQHIYTLDGSEFLKISEKIQINFASHSIINLCEATNEYLSMINQSCPIFQSI